MSEMTNIIEVLVPDMGDIHDVEVIEVLARVGAEVKIDQTLAVLETEKATMDVPSTAAGKILEVLIKVGDKVNEGTILVLLEPAQTQNDTAAYHTVAVHPIGAETAPQFQIVTPETVAHTAPTAVKPAPAAPLMLGGNTPHASPSVRRFARELGIDLACVQGNGPKSRILHSDIQATVRSALAAAPLAVSSANTLNLLPWPQVDFARFGPVERAPLSKIKKISGANLTRNAVLIPHVTNFDEADITDLESFRVELNAQQARNRGRDDEAAKLTMLAFLIKASVHALKLHPHFNASLDGDELILKRYFHIGFAADTPNGLVVPVIRDADTKGLVALAAEASTLAAKAREGKLQAAEMQGSCFTISSLGGIGGTGFTPIINAPELAILGAARARMQPVWTGDSFLPRLVLPLTLSWDHRVIDGAEAARFLVTLTSMLKDFRRISL